jgi:ABC-type multidrug transport system permease subunit
LDRHLKGWWFVIYWSACLVFTLLAMVTAWLDWRVVRSQRGDE